MTLPILNESDLVRGKRIFKKTAPAFDISTALCLGDRVTWKGVPCFQVYTEGGGPVSHVPITRLMQQCVFAEPSDLSPTYRKGRFRLGDDPTVFEGYTDGRRWNGWACPFFSETEFAKIRARLWADAIDPNDEEPKLEWLEGTCFYDPAIDPKHAIWFSNGVMIRVRREEFTFDGQTFHIFDCGDMGFCWEEVDEQDNDGSDAEVDAAGRGSAPAAP